MASFDTQKLNRDGKVFLGGNTAAATMSAVGTAMTGLILINPPHSGVDIVLLEAGWAFTTVPGAVHNIGLALVPANNPIAPTSVGVSVTSAGRAADGSGRKPMGILCDAATYVAPLPVAARWSFNVLYQAADATLTTVWGQQMSDRVDGSIIVVPGASVMFARVTTASVGLGSFVWAEYPRQS